MYLAMQIVHFQGIHSSFDRLSFVSVRWFDYLFCICIFFLYLFIFILHSRESELYRYILDGTSALAWELPFFEVSGPPVFHIKAEASR